MIAIVLLIAFTVAVAGILTTWGTGLLGTTTGAVESGTEYKIKCSSVLLQLKNIKYYGDTRNGLVGYWKFDDGSGSTATDSSGNGNTGTLTNMNTTGNNPTSGWNSTDCKFGSCLKFDGENDYVNVLNSASLSITDKITISAWIKTTDYDGAIASKVSGGASTSAYSLWYSGNALITIYSGSTQDSVQGTTITYTGAWKHIVGTYDSVTKELKIYVNGVLENSKVSTTISTINSVAASVNIGQDPNSVPTYSFNGTIDDVRIYNRALSAGEIQDEYQYQSFIRGLLLHTGGAESVNNATITAAGGGYVNTTTAFATSAFDPGSGYSFTMNTTGGVSTAPDIISVTAKCGNIGVVGECNPGQGCMSSG